MALFTFYLFTAGGGALTFEALELGSEAAAADRADCLLKDHSSAVVIEVWREETKVMQVQRHPAG